MSQVTYYWDFSTLSDWTDPSYMWDGNLANFAYTSSDGDKGYGKQTNCPGTDLGTITKVELRVYAHGDVNDRIDLALSVGTMDPEYQTTPGVSEDWGTGYVDVTNDPNVNGWTWAKVADLYGETGLYCVVEKDNVSKGNAMYCSKVEIRVTYTEPWVPPVSDIDVGADPIDRGSFYASGFTLIDKNNPANASGTLQSVKVWAQANITGFRVGTFYTTNGNTLKCRDSELIGDGTVEAGAERTFTGLSITVVAGDYIGCYFAGGNIEYDTAGFAGVWWVNSEQIDPDDEAVYTLNAGDAVSLYGYGDIGVLVPRHPVVNFQNPGIV